MPTDLFYASPDYDLVPNYHLGRLSVSDPAEALNVVEKVERWHVQAQTGWIKKVYLVNTWGMTRFDSLRKGFFDGFHYKRLAGIDAREEPLSQDAAQADVRCCV